MLDAAYRNAHSRIAELVAGLGDAQLEAPVPATPGWTVHELVAHLVGGAADAVSGRLDGAPGEQWTARHVAERRDRPIGELLAEWDRVAPQAEADLAGQQFTGPNLAIDAICHEADLREALGMPPVEREHWQQPFLEVLMRTLDRRLRGLASVLIHDETGRQWQCGSAESAGWVLRAEAYEVLRALLSRRSQRQIADWAWSSAPPARVVEQFGVFGPRDDDQPVPTR
ncbi:MAG: maleylpyruvate isomerase family mycothiol-dependent enzyme [Actinomycetota bacterium]|nr:maleylpyruvate isomerase family mycothiol-dependent enzyme [Actinomycetota bacterium]